MDFSEKHRVPIEDLTPSDAASPHKKFLDHWLALRRDRLMPAYSDFDPIEAPWALPHIFVLDALPDGDFAYRIAGAVLEDRYNRTLRGARISDIMQPDGAKSILKRWGMVRDMPAGCYVVTNHASKQGGYVTGQRLILPLGDDGQNTNHLVAITSFISRSSLALHLIGDQQVKLLKWSRL